MLATCAPILVQFLSFSCRFRQKSCQIVDFWLKLRGSLPLSGPNPSPSPNFSLNPNLGPPLYPRAFNGQVKKYGPSSQLFRFNVFWCYVSASETAYILSFHLYWFELTIHVSVIHLWLYRIGQCSQEGQENSHSYQSVVEECPVSSEPQSKLYCWTTPIRQEATTG